VTKPPTLINILLTTRALTPGKLLAKPHTIRPIVLPIPITETSNIAVEASMLAFIARSAKKTAELKSILHCLTQKSVKDYTRGRRKQK